MPRTSGDYVPSLRRHRAIGLAVVTLRSPHGSTRDYYLGCFGSEEARQRYQQLIATWFAMGRQLPDPELKTAGEMPLSIADLVTDRPCCTTCFTASSLNSRLCFLRELPIGSSSFRSLTTPNWVSTFSGQHN